MQKYSTAR